MKGTFCSSLPGPALFLQSGLGGLLCSRIRKGWERRGCCHRAAGSSAPPSDRMEQGSKTQAPEGLMELKTRSFSVLGVRKDTPARHFTGLLLSLMGNALLSLPLVCRVG